MVLIVQKYHEGQEIRLGDKIDYNGQIGNIVIIAGHPIGFDGFNFIDWKSDILAGILIQFTNGALLHISAPLNDEHLRLIQRETHKG